MEKEDDKDKEEECSPLKKQAGSSKSSTKRRSTRPKVTPPKPKFGTQPTSITSKTTSFLDNFIYPHSQIILELAITLKSDKAFKEFTHTLMAFLTSAQMINFKFVINPLNPQLKEKYISLKGESPQI